MVAAGLVGVAVAPTAGAHVTVSDTEQTAGAYTVLTFSVPHGCAGSATTEVAIKIPEPIADVTPTVNPNWDVEKKMAQLDSPIDDGHGGELTERVDQVVYTAKTPLPDGLRDAFELSLQVPDEPGETLYFPVVQKCEEGETAWIQTPSEGQSSHDLDEPAPAVEIVAAADGAADSHGDAGHDDGAADTDDASQASDDVTVAGTATPEKSSDSNGTATAALVIAIIGLVVALGGVGLAMSRRNTTGAGSASGDD